MATTKVSALSALTTTDGAEELLINDGGTSKKVTIDNVLHDNSIRAEHYVDESVTTAHIANDAITADKLDNSINTAIAANTAKTTNATHTGDVTGATSLTIANDAVDSEHYVDGSIDTAHLANDAVTGAKIADDAIDSEHYTDGSIDTAHYAAGSVDATALGADAVTAAKIGDNVLNSEHYAAGSIDLEHMSSESVDEDNLHISNSGSNGNFLQKQSGNSGGLTWAATAISDDSVDSDAYVDGSIDSAHLSADCVTGAKIADDAIDSEHYTDGSIDNAHIADDAIDSEHYADGSIDNAHIADDAIDSEHYADGSIDAAHLAADCVTGAKIADDAIDSEHYTDGSIDNAHIADDAIDSEHYAAGSIDTAHIADSQVTLAKTTGLVGKQTIWVPANAMTPTTSNGCAAIAAVETTAGRPDMYVLDFDKDADEFAQFTVAFPKMWNLGTITYQVFWSGLAATTGVSWQLLGVGMGDNTTIDVVYGTPIVVDDDAQGAVEELLVSAESGAVTIAGTPADNDLTYFKIGRDISDSNDDMAGDARLHGVKIFYTTDALTDA